MDAATRSQVLRDALAEPLAAHGIDLSSLDLSSVGRRRVLRVALARDVSSLAPDDHTSVVEPLSLDEVAEATRTVSDTLDDEPASRALGETPYTLEVGSAGVSASLTSWADFRRNVGRLLRVHPGEGDPVTGRLVAVDADALTLLVPGTPDGEEQRTPLADVDRGVVQVEFTKPRDD